MIITSGDYRFFNGFNIIFRKFIFKNSIYIGSNFAFRIEIRSNIFSVFVIKHSKHALFYKINISIIMILFTQKFAFINGSCFAFFIEESFYLCINFYVFFYFLKNPHSINFLQNYKKRALRKKFRSAPNKHQKLKTL